jgi:hypothetical protein
LKEKILVVDCQLAGIAGDMLVGALIDLGVDIDDFLGAMNNASNYLEGYPGFQVNVESVDRRGFQAKKLHVYPDDHQRSHDHTHNNTVEHEHSNENNHNHKHVHGSEIKNAIIQMTKDLGLSEAALTLGESVIDSLINAEAKMHGSTPDQVHLHEAGTIDTVVDVVGTVYAMEKLGLFSNTKIYGTPVAVGGGLFEFSHGKVSSPAPATLEILRSYNYPMKGGPIRFELTTPTGAALLVNIVDEVKEFYPAFKPASVGYGAGAKNFEVMPNVVRLTLGEPLPSFFLTDEIIVLETNLDDVSGETLGYAIDRIMAEGALDISVIPTVTKKNRPGYVIKVITDKVHLQSLTHTIMEETGTLGVRFYSSQRHIAARKTETMSVSIEGLEEEVRYKISKTLDGEVIQVKPEHEDLVRLAAKTGIPLRLLSDLVKKKIELGDVLG